jgi:hypothetical protein
MMKNKIKIGIASSLLLLLCIGFVSAQEAGEISAKAEIRDLDIKTVKDNFVFTFYLTVTSDDVGPRAFIPIDIAIDIEDLIDPNLTLTCFDPKASWDRRGRECKNKVQFGGNVMNGELNKVVLEIPREYVWDSNFTIVVGVWKDGCVGVSPESTCKYGVKNFGTKYLDGTAEKPRCLKCEIIPIQQVQIQFPTGNIPRVFPLLAMKCGRLNKLGAYPFKITDKDGNPLCRYAGKEAPGPYAAEGYCQITFKDSMGNDLDYDAYEISGASGWWAFPCELIKKAYEEHGGRNYGLQVEVLPVGDYVKTSSRIIYFNWKWEWGPTTQPPRQTTPKERAEEKKSCLDVGGTHCAPSGQCGTGFEEIMGTKCDDIDEVCCKPLTEPTPSSTDVSSMEVSFSHLTQYSTPKECYGDAKCREGLMKITGTCTKDVKGDISPKVYIWPGMRTAEDGLRIYVSGWDGSDTLPGEVPIANTDWSCTRTIIGHDFYKYICGKISVREVGEKLSLKITRPSTDLCSSWKVAKFV